MTLVERLRFCARTPGHEDVSHELDEAADEIERLTTQRDALVVSLGRQDATTDRLRLENDRLTAALADCEGIVEDQAKAMALLRAALVAAGERITTLDKSVWVMGERSAALRARAEKAEAALLKISTLCNSASHSKDIASRALEGKS